MQTWFLNNDNKIMHIPSAFPDSIIWTEEDIIPICCIQCKQHPINGGNGICNCIAPLTENKIKIDYE